MKWNECSRSEKHTCNCIFWNLFFFFSFWVGGRVGGGDLCILFQRFSGPRFSPGKFGEICSFLQIKHGNFPLSLTHSSFPLHHSPFFSFNLLVELMAAIHEVCQRVYRCMCVYCMYANITEGHILIKISVVQLISFSLAWVVLQSQVFEIDDYIFNSL